MVLMMMKKRKADDNTDTFMTEEAGLWWSIHSCVSLSFYQLQDIDWITSRNADQEVNPIQQNFTSGVISMEASHCSDLALIPVYKSKARIMVREDTELKKFALF